MVHLVSGYRWAFFGLEGDNVAVSLGVTFAFILILLSNLIITVMVFGS